MFELSVKENDGIYFELNAILQKTVWLNGLFSQAHQKMRAQLSIPMGDLIALHNKVRISESTRSIPLNIIYMSREDICDN